MNNPEKTTGRKIVELRRAKNISGHTLAKKAGIAHERLSMIESDMIRNPSREHIAKIAEVLEVALEELL